MKFSQVNVWLVLILLLGPGAASGEYQFVSSFGSFGTAEGQFNAPRGVAIDLDGQIIITESGNHRVQVCDDAGNCSAWGSFGTESGQFDRPRGVTVTTDNRIFIADRGNDRIQSCNHQGVCTAFGNSGTGLGQFDSPRGIVAMEDGRLAVTDTDNDRIQLCTTDGVCSAFGGTGSGLGQFRSPAGIAQLSDGRLAIADRGNDRVQLCNTSGFCTFFGGTGNTAGKFDTPAGVAVTSEDRVVVVDRFNDRLQVCSTTGECSVTGSFGSGNGQFKRPWGVAVDDADRIIVADLENNRVQILALANVVAIDSFTASPATVVAGEPVLLSWSVSNASQCEALDGTAEWLAVNPDPAGGSFNVPLANAGVVMFTLRCSDGNNEVTRSVAVTVNPANFQINAGLNDAWVSDGAPLQGFFFTVFPGLEVFFLSWFTFDSDIPAGPDGALFGAHDHRWVTASGSYAGNVATLSVELTSGGVFNGSDPLATQIPGYGTITIEFLGCNQALLNYSFPSLGLSGQVTLTRVLPSNVALCEALSGN